MLRQTRPVGGGLVCVVLMTCAHIRHVIVWRGPSNCMASSRKLCKDIPNLNRSRLISWKETNKRQNEKKRSKPSAAPPKKKNITKCAVFTSPLAPQTKPPSPPPSSSSSSSWSWSSLCSVRMGRSSAALCQPCPRLALKRSTMSPNTSLMQFGNGGQGVCECKGVLQGCAARVCCKSVCVCVLHLTVQAKNRWG